MEQQRPLRLGDLVDDYCPRERRVTNHAIVAIVEDAIRQTRCTTCEADHVYRGGRAPVRKKKDEKAVLYDQVLANVTSGHTAAAPPVPPPQPDEPVQHAAAEPMPDPIVPLAAAPAVTDHAPAPASAPAVDEPWSLHRPLIRASLPRNDSQPPTPRAIPEFTMHQRNVRGSQHYRGGGQSNGGFDRGAGANGNGGGYRGGFRADGAGPGQGGQGGPGQPGSPNGQRPGGGRRRRRHKKPKPQI